MRQSDRLVRNTLYNIGGHFWTILVSLLLVPYVIHRIGIERYGIWALISVLTNYLGLFDLGIGASFVRYIAEYHGRGDDDGVNRVVNTGLAFYLLLALPLLLAAWFFLDPLMALLNVPAGLRAESRLVFLAGTALFGFANLLRPLCALPPGFQRMDLSNHALVALSVPQFAGTVIFLELGYGLPGLMLNLACVLLCSAFLNAWIAWRLFPGLRLRPAAVSLPVFRRLFGYGYKIQLSLVAGWVQGQLDKFLLAHFLGVGPVTYYAAAANLVGRIKELPLLIVSAVLPAAAELDARRDHSTLVRLYDRSMRYVAAISLPLSSLAVTVASPLITLWLGPGFALSALTLQILMVGYLFNLLTGPGATVLNGMGQPQYAMWSALIAIPVNLALSITLVIRIGYAGVVIGTAVSLAVSALYFLVTSHRVLRLSLGHLVGGLLFKPIVAAGVASLVTFFLRRHAPLGWISLAAISAVHLGVAALILLLLRYLDDEDTRMLYNRLRAKVFAS